MIITRITLCDYGTYRGTNEFDLEPREGRPVILVGGTNGAGKTTLFESVMLCLYGMASGRYHTRRSYHAALIKRIHRRPDGSRAGGASVAVRFRFHHNGQVTEYAVRRSWTGAGGKAEEELDVRSGPPEGGEEGMSPLDTVERAHWQEFIGGLIPRGIANLFFFDGERVVRMAREGTEDAVIRESFGSLLGIEVVEQLRSDLQVSLARSLRGGDAALRDRFEGYDKEKREYKRSVGLLREAAARKRGEIDAVSREIEAAESAITRIGGGFADRREEAVRALAEKRAAYGEVHKRLAELCAGVLPMAMIPGRLQDLKGRLEADEDARRRAAGTQMANSKLREARTRAGRGFWEGEAGLPAREARRAATAVRRLLDSLAETEPEKAPTFGFSPEQASRMVRVMDGAGNGVLEPLRADTQEIVRLGEEVAALEGTLASAPRDDELGKQVSAIGRLRTRQGELRAETDHLEQKEASHISMIRQLDARLRETVQAMHAARGAETGADLSRKVQLVLDEMIRRMRAQKVGLLERYLREALGMLLRKRALIEEVRVDPATFEVTLYRGGHRLAKDTLSEGEKQMLAMAVLWALAKTSGRPLPFLIDTPLARLDEAHRSNVVERFLPTASHQSVVLSTDTEVGEAYHGRLSPYLARAYAMEYDEGAGAVRVHDGYFWEGGRRTVAV